MKKLFVVVTILNLVPFLTLAQKKIEIYISSNDCIKCVAGLANILNFYETNGISKSELKIFTDYNSNKTRLLRDVSGVTFDMITCDKKLVSKIIPDNISACLVEDTYGRIIKIPLSELSSERLAGLLEHIIDPVSINYIPDTIFERGNFRTFGDSNKLVLFQKVLQKFLIIEFNNDSVFYTYHDEIVSRYDFENMRNLLQSRKEMNLLDFDSSSILNKKVALPMGRVSANCVDDNSLITFKDVYFYERVDHENLANNGYTYVEKHRIHTHFDSTQSKSRNLVEPFLMEDSTLVRLFTLYDHQKIANNRYFSYFIPSGDNDGRMLKNQYIACIYSIGENGIELLKIFRFGEVNISDSLQIKLRKFFYSNNQKYFSINGKDFILYKNFAIVLDLNAGEAIPLEKFIEHYFSVNHNIASIFIFDVVVAGDSLEIVYLDNKTPSSLIYSKFHADKKVETYKLKHKGDIDYLAINGKILTLLTKMDDDGTVLIKRYRVP